MIFENFLFLLNSFSLRSIISIFTNFKFMLIWYKMQVKFSSSVVTIQFSRHHVLCMNQLVMVLSSLSKVGWTKLGYFFILQSISSTNKLVLFLTSPECYPEIQRIFIVSTIPMIFPLLILLLVSLICLYSPVVVPLIFCLRQFLVSFLLPCHNHLVIYPLLCNVWSWKLQFPSFSSISLHSFPPYSSYDYFILPFM